MKPLVPSVLALLLCAGTCPLQAAETAPLPASGPIPFAVYDLDGDGSVSAQEFNTVRDRRLVERDRAGRPMGGMAGEPAFSDFDADGDGLLTPAELEQGRQQRQQGRPGMGQGMGSSMGQGANMPAFTEFDADADGAISEQEYVDGRNRRIAERAAAGYPMRGLGQTVDFSAVDSDGNGSLSPEEFAAQQAGHGSGR